MNNLIIKFIYGIQINREECLDIIKDNYDLSLSELNLIDEYNISKTEDDVKKIDKLISKYMCDEVSLHYEHFVVDLEIGQIPDNHIGVNNINEKYYLGKKLTYDISIGAYDFTSYDICDFFGYTNVEPIDKALEKISETKPQLMVILD